MALDEGLFWCLNGDFPCNLISWRIQRPPCYSRPGISPLWGTAGLARASVLGTGQCGHSPVGRAGPCGGALIHSGAMPGPQGPVNYWGQAAEVHQERVAWRQREHRPACLSGLSEPHSLSVN